MIIDTSSATFKFVLKLGGATLTTVAVVGALELFSSPTQKPKPLATTTPPAAFVAPEPAPEDPLFGASHYAVDLVPDAVDRELVAYGRELIDHTDRLIGPLAQDESLRFTSSGLTCDSCHLDVGLKKFAAPYVGVSKRYPNFRNRENQMGGIEQRINGCMERSMNGRALPEDGREMKAMVAYMTWLGRLTDSKGTVAEKEFLPANYPDRAVNLERGRAVYEGTCALCHGPDALGKKDPSGQGYQFPPLAGEASYNTGAGMHRVLTAMAFIKGNMPLGATADKPTLSDDDAYDVAGFINSLPRPEKANTDADFPDRKLKSMSTPYGPYADDFPQEQHKFGPFPPIYAYYESKYNLKKKN